MGKAKKEKAKANFERKSKRDSGKTIKTLGDYYWSVAKEELAKEVPYMMFENYMKKGFVGNYILNFAKKKFNLNDEKEIMSVKTISSVLFLHALEFDVEKDMFTFNAESEYQGFIDYLESTIVVINEHAEQAKEMSKEDEEKLDDFVKFHTRSDLIYDKAVFSYFLESFKNNTIKKEFIKEEEEVKEDKE